MRKRQAVLEKYFDRLWPINRSIMGEGFRESLNILEELMPMTRLSFSTGDKILDWTVPEEWHVEQAYFIAPNGEKYCDFKENNLHLIGYSTPFEGKVGLDELKKHLYYLDNQPKAVPYVTSYYERRWGFCIAYDDFQSLPEGEYQVVIKSKFCPGQLIVGETVLPGETKDEVLFTSYLCHPSMANNELSGPLTLVFLYDALKEVRNRTMTYRFALMPETIGGVAYLSERGDYLKRHLEAGYVLTCIGDRGPFTYKLTREGDGVADRVARRILKQYDGASTIPFDPSTGGDERQFSSPGFQLAVGSLMRTCYMEYPEYHTSLDNKEFISFEALSESVDMCLRLVQYFENREKWINQKPYGEPQLGKYDLYRSLSTKDGLDESLAVMFWILNLADGKHDLQDIAERSGYPLSVVEPVIKKIAKTGLLKKSETTFNTF